MSSFVSGVSFPVLVMIKSRQMRQEPILSIVGTATLSYPILKGFASDKHAGDAVILTATDGMDP